MSSDESENDASRYLSVDVEKRAEHDAVTKHLKGAWACFVPCGLDRLDSPVFCYPLLELLSITHDMPFS